MSLVDLGKKLLEAARAGQDDEVRILMANGAPFTTDWVKNDFNIVGAFFFLLIFPDKNLFSIVFISGKKLNFFGNFFAILELSSSFKGNVSFFFILDNFIQIFCL